MLRPTLDLTAHRIANFYSTNNVGLASALTRLASGRKVQTPSDNIGDFFRAEKIHRENRVSQYLRREVGEAIALVDAAEAAGSVVFDSLTRMRDLAQLYWHADTSSEERDAYRMEFDALRARVDRTIGNAYYDDRLLVAQTGGSPLRKVRLNPDDFTSTLDVEFDAGDVADVSALVVTGPDETTVTAAIQAEMDKAASYLGKVSAYSAGLHSHYNIMATKEIVNDEVHGQLVESDMATEMANVVDRDVRQQMSLAMLVQGNMFRGGILALLNVD